MGMVNRRRRRSQGDYYGATIVQPTTDTGYETYLNGSRLFLPAGTNLVVDPQGVLADGTFWPADTAHTDTTANQALPVAFSAQSTVTKCLKLVNDGTADAPETATIAVSASKDYTASLYVYAPTLGGNLVITAENGHSFTVATIVAANTGWTRYSIYAPTVVGETTVKLKFAFAGGTASTVYVTGAMVESSAILTPYFDGSTADSLNASTYAWTGTANASTSTRAATYLAYSSSGILGPTMTFAARLVPLATNFTNGILLYAEHSPADGWYSYLLSTAASTTAYYRDGAGSNSISSAAALPAGGTASAVYRAAAAATLDLMINGSAAAQVATTKTPSISATFSVGVNSANTTQRAHAYIGPVAISPSRITDPETTALDAMLRAGATGPEVYKFFKDKGYSGTLVLPLAGDSRGYRVP